MKRFNVHIFGTILILLFARFESFAQVMEEKRVMSKGEQSSLTIEIPGVEASYTDDVYKDFIKDFKGKTKKDKKANEWSSEGAKVASIANGAPIGIYSKIEGSGNKSVVNMWIDLGTGYVNSSTYPAEYQEAQKLLNKFAQTVKVQQAQDELAALDKEMKKMDSDMKKLKRDNDDYHKEIEKCNQKIKDAQNSILKNEDDQKNKKMAIDQQAVKLDAAKDKLSKIQSN